jgi:hypothetical protein
MRKRKAAAEASVRSAGLSEQILLGLVARLFRHEAMIRKEVAGIGRLIGKLIATLVFGLTGMPLHPTPIDFVGSGREIDPFPEIGILEILIIGPGPSA